MRTSAIKIRIERVDSWEGLDLCDYATREVILAKSAGKFQTSTDMWLLSIEEKPMLVAGLTRTSLLGSGAEVWIMLCRDGASQMRHYLGFMRRALRRLLRLFGGLRAVVQEDFWAGHRFAQFFGFEEVGEVKAMNGTGYVVYEVRQWQWR